MYHLIGSSREYIQAYTIYSEIPEKYIIFIYILRKVPKRLFCLYKSFGNIQMI